MKNIANKKRWISALTGMLLFILVVVGLFGYSENAKATCTKTVTCDKCNGFGFIMSDLTPSSGKYTGGVVGGKVGSNSYDTGGYVSTFSYASYRTKSGCASCGGAGSLKVYYKNTDGTSSNDYIEVGTTYSKGDGDVTTGNCSYGGVYFDSNGITDGGWSWKCQVCGDVENTEYKLILTAGQGIASVSPWGTNWYVDGTTVTVSCTPKTGYHFTKWSNGDTRQSWSTPMSSAKSFTAYGEANKYTVSYNANGGTGSMSDSVATYDEAFKTRQNTYTRAGYTFTGWNEKADGTGTAWSLNTAGVYESGKSWTWAYTKNVTLYAQWKEATYKVSYDSNGGTGTMSPSEVTYGTDFKTKKNVFQRPGYIFNGWNEKSDGTGTAWNLNMAGVYESGNSWNWTYAKDITLYAQWKENTYKVSYNANGGKGTMNDSEVVYGADFITSKNTFKRQGYTFNGWNEKADGTGTPWNLDSAGVFESEKVWKWTYVQNITLYARWTQNEYKVTFHANGGSMEVAEKTYHYNEQVDLSPTAEKDGKIFVGWSLEPDGRIPLGSLNMPDLATSQKTEYSDWELTLYAVYSIPVSDVANHTYPDYEKKSSWEVFVRIYDYEDKENYRDYELTYTLDTSTMVYQYVLNMDISDFVGKMESYYYRVYAYDNVQNWNVIYEDKVGKDPGPIPPEEEDPTPKSHRQTVKHYKYDPVSKEYKKFANDTGEDVEEGNTYTPSFVSAPEGYEPDYIKYPEGYEEAGKIINGAYKVTEEATSETYYRPCKYMLTFDANGGKIEVNGVLVSKKTGKIAYSDCYDNVGYDENSDGIFEDEYGFPTPMRDGYTFNGWYTKGGVKVRGSDLYLTEGDSTLYADWKINRYTVTYDYWTNGGTGAATTQKKYEYGARMDLSVSAQKNGNGWRFVGWNTNPDANVGLSELSMPDHDVTVYAIFKKDITVTTLERDKIQTVVTKQTKTIYNNEESADFTISSMVGQDNVWNEWTLLGWTTETGAEEAPVVGIGNNYTCSDDVTLYAVYTSEVTLNYDTNGSSMVIEPQTKDCFYNASGESKYPTFVVAKEPVLSQHSFVSWHVVEGRTWDTENNPIFLCMPKDQIIIKENTVLKTFWDKHPMIEAYNRYFTLEEAQNGEITQAELLEKVTATDEEAKALGNEEGRLINGTDVIVKDYDASDFTGITTDKSVDVTYQATDSFGNIVTKTITVTITDTSMKKSTKKNYVRFISSNFFDDENGNILSSNEGGLEETSIWRLNENYQSLLHQTFYDEGNEEEVWIFTMQDIRAVKEYTSTYGYILTAIEEFIERFQHCKQAK